MENVSRHYNRLKKSRLFCLEMLERYSLSRKCCLRAVSQKMKYICNESRPRSLSSTCPVSQCQSCRPVPCGFEHLQGAGRDSLFFLRASTIDPQLQCLKACPYPSQSCPAQLVKDDLSSSMPEPIVRLRQSHSAEPTVNGAMGSQCAIEPRNLKGACAEYFSPIQGKNKIMLNKRGLIN